MPAAAVVPARSRPIPLGSPDVLSLLLKVAWMSVALGFAMQLLTMLAAKLAGGADPAIAVVLRDLVGKVAWATFVCIGLAIGAAATKARAAWTGLLGLLAAPAGFVVARMLQKGVSGALSLAPPDAMGSSVFWSVLLLKALEYAALGVMIVWIASRPWAGFRVHLLIGFSAGVLFGGTIVAILAANANPTMPTVRLVAQSVNEVIFPVGCSIVLFAAHALGRRLQQG